jgi:hypothetical protein
MDGYRSGIAAFFATLDITDVAADGYWGEPLDQPAAGSRR